MSEQCERPSLGHASIRPVLQTKIVSLKNQPEWNREQCNPGKLSGSIMQTGTPSHGQHGGVREQDVASPRDRSRVNRHWLNAGENKYFSGQEPNQPGQTIESQPPLPMAKKSNHQNRGGQKRNRQPHLRHPLMVPHHQLPWRLPTA